MDYDDEKRTGNEAYFTVEAAFVLPIVFSALLSIIYLFLFQYDRCLLEQDVGSLVLWGGVVPAESGEDLKEQLIYRASGIYHDKYFAWKTTDIDIRLERNRISVMGKGKVIFPLPGWNIWNRDNVWETEVKYTSERISPVFFIRQYRKLRGEK